jgi:hypothetical protein
MGIDMGDSLNEDKFKRCFGLLTDRLISFGLVYNRLLIYLEETCSSRISRERSLWRYLSCP